MQLRRQFSSTVKESRSNRPATCNKGAIVIVSNKLLLLFHSAPREICNPDTLHVEQYKHTSYSPSPSHGILFEHHLPFDRCPSHEILLKLVCVLVDVCIGGHVFLFENTLIALEVILSLPLLLLQCRCSACLLSAYLQLLFLGLFIF